MILFYPRGAWPVRNSPSLGRLQVVRPEAVKAAKSWVGDFGHLDEPR